MSAAPKRNFRSANRTYAYTDTTITQVRNTWAIESRGV